MHTAATVLTSVLVLLSAQLVEVPLHRFKGFAEPSAIAAIALSPDAHTVSVWTRWSAQTPCVRWTIKVQTGATEGLGEDACPEPSPLTSHPIELVDARLTERSLDFLSRPGGKLLSSFRHAGSSIRGVAASDGEWLLWTQAADGSDHLYLADDAELTGPLLERPYVRPLARIRLPATFGWKKDTTAVPDSPCEFFERGALVEDDVLLLDWPAQSNPIDVRVRLRNGKQQKWSVDVASATPLPGLQVERVQLPRQQRWRLRIRFPFAVEQLAISPAGKVVQRLRPVAMPVSTTSGEPTCLFVEGELRPERFMLDPLLR